MRVEPNYGPPATGAWITVRGRGFVKGMSGTLGGVPLRDVSVWDAKTANAYVPPAPPGEVDLTLTIPGKGVVRAPKAFGYEPPAAGAFVDVSPLVLGREQAPVGRRLLEAELDPLVDLFEDAGNGAEIRGAYLAGVVDDRFDGACKRAHRAEADATVERENVLGGVRHRQERHRDVAESDVAGRGPAAQQFDEVPVR